MDLLIELYRFKIFEIYRDLINDKKELNNYALARIFKYYSCIQLTNEHNKIR